MAKSVRIRRTGGADRRGCLAVAVSAFLAALGGPAAADECSDYRTALVQYHATDRALDDTVAKLTDDLDSGEVNEASFRVNEGNVRVHTIDRVAETPPAYPSRRKKTPYG